MAAAVLPAGPPPITIRSWCVVSMWAAATLSHGRGSLLMRAADSGTLRRRAGGGPSGQDGETRRMKRACDPSALLVLGVVAAAALAACRTRDPTGPVRVGGVLSAN